MILVQASDELVTEIFTIGTRYTDEYFIEVIEGLNSGCELVDVKHNKIRNVIEFYYDAHDGKEEVTEQRVVYRKERRGDTLVSTP